jgi:hypothetical protein
MRRINKFLLLFLIAPMLMAGEPQPRLTIYSPKAGSAWVSGRSYKLQWTKTGAMKSEVMLVLYSGDVKIASISEKIENSGNFNWKIPESIKPGSYSIRMETTDHAVRAASGTFRIVLLPKTPRPGLEKPGMLPHAAGDILKLPLMPSNLVKPDFSKMEFEFVESHVYSDKQPPWFILKYRAKKDPRYLKSVFRLRPDGKGDYVDYRHVFKFKESAKDKEIVVEKKILRQLKFTAPKYAAATYRRDTYEKIIQLLTYRRYLVANGYFESSWDRIEDFFTDVGNLIDMAVTITEAVFGDVDYERIAKIAKNFYGDCIEIKNEDLYDRCVNLWYEINDLIIEHGDEVQLDYLDKADGVYNRISKVNYIDLVSLKPLIM